MEKTFHNFSKLNQNLFDFLGVTPLIVDSRRNLKLSFQSSGYIGAIPLRSPVKGRALGDFIVYPRYSDQKNPSNEYIEIIDLLDEKISPEFDYSFDLVSRDQAKPPIFFECIKYIDLLFHAINENWKKFDSKNIKSPYPKGRIMWSDYAKSEWNPYKRTEYPCKIN